MFLIAVLALFGNGYQYQKAFDHCLRDNFERPECAVHEEMLRANPKSMHYKND